MSLARFAGDLIETEAVCRPEIVVGACGTVGEYWAADANGLLVGVGASGPPLLYVDLEGRAEVLSLCKGIWVFTRPSASRPRTAAMWHC